MQIDVHIVQYSAYHAARFLAAIDKNLQDMKNSEQGISNLYAKTVVHGFSKQCLFCIIRGTSYVSFIEHLAVAE